MEKNLERVMDEIISSPGVYGCVFADGHGLCLGAKGKASTESAGILAAIAKQAGKLEPHRGQPVITYENDRRTCIVQRCGAVTGAIYKDVQPHDVA